MLPLYKELTDSLMLSKELTDSLLLSKELTDLLLSLYVSVIKPEWLKLLKS